MFQTKPQNPFQRPGAPAQVPQNPFQRPGAPAQVPQTAPQQPTQPVPTVGPASGGFPPGNIAPHGAGAPVPQAQGYAAPTAGPAPMFGGPGQMPGGFPGMPFDPFAAVQSAALTRGQRLFLKAEDQVLAEIVRTKLSSGQKGVAFVIELRVLWSQTGVNPVGAEPSVVIKQGHYFGPEVKTWMCALMGLLADRDMAHIGQIDAAHGQWSQLCALACYSSDNKMQGPGPFAGTIVRIDCFRKLRIDRTGVPVIDPITKTQQSLELARPEAVAQSVRESLLYMRACINPAQDPHAEQHYGVIKAALERRLPVPAYDPNALAARVQAATGGGGQVPPSGSPQGGAPAAPTQSGYTQPVAAGIPF